MPRFSDTTEAIAKARAGVIEMPVALRVRDTAHLLMQGKTVHEDTAELFILCMGPLLDELIAYRERAAEAMEASLPEGMPGNVIPLLRRD